MQKKRLLSLLVIVGLFTITGCGNKKEEKSQIKDNQAKEDLSKYDNLSDEEKIWIMANEDEIYNQRIFIRDSILLSSTKDRKNLIKYQYHLLKAE